MNVLGKRIRTSFDRQRFLTLLGAGLEEGEPGSVMISCRRKPELTRQRGFCMVVW